jgi:hypothetical protein
LNASLAEEDDDDDELVEENNRVLQVVVNAHCCCWLLEKKNLAAVQAFDAMGKFQPTTNNTTNRFGTKSILDLVMVDGYTIIVPAYRWLKWLVSKFIPFFWKDIGLPGRSTLVPTCVRGKKIP